MAPPVIFRARWAHVRRRPRLRAAALAALTFSGSIAIVAGGQGRAGADDAIVIEDPRLDPSLAGVQVEGDGYRSALSASRVADGRLAAARDRLAALTDLVTTQTAERERLQAEKAEAERIGEAARAELDRRQASLRALAVQSYMQGRDSGADPVLGGGEAAATTARQDAMVNDVAERRTEQVKTALSIIDDTDATLARVSDDLTLVQGRLEQSTASTDAAETEVAATGRSAADARQNLADWRLAANVAGSDLPLIALDAYVRAAARMAFERPECGIRWSGLAGIGKVESGHGSFRGTRLTASGNTSAPIVGIPLDGTNGTALIGDTDGGEFDGDPFLDRAVGPMQFIPGSWRTLGRDGNGDGRADPSNIYDAALAAAGLLCRSGGSDLDADAGLRRGALGYNASAPYADLVVRTANAYSANEARLIPPPPTTTATTDPATTDPITTTAPADPPTAPAETLTPDP